jgi:hypothetical protein
MGRLVMVDVDRWVPLTADVEIFIWRDALTDSGYRVRVEVSTVDGLQVRCLAPLPAGFWLRSIHRGREFYVPVADRYTTDQFRIDVEEH